MKKFLIGLFISIFIFTPAYSEVKLQSYTENSDLVDDYIDMARLYTSSAEYEKALEYIDTIEKISPNNPKIMYEKAIILKNYNQPILARNLMREVAEIAPEYKESYLYKEFFKDDLPGFYMPKNFDADYYLKKGIEFYDDCKYDKALNYLKKAVQQRKDVIILNYLGKAFLKTGDNKMALKCFEDAINLDVRAPETYINLAMYYCDVYKDSKKQIHYLKQAIRLNPKNAEPFYQLGNVYLEKGLYETAVEYYRHALTKDDSYFDAYYALGSTLFKLQDYEECYLVFQKTLHIELDNPKVYEYLAKSAIQLRKFEEAKSYINRAILIEPTPDNYLLLAEILCLSQDYNNAINVLKTKIADTKNSKMYNFLGLCYYHLNNYQDAIFNFNKALSIEKKPIYFYNLAVCYNTIGDTSQMQANLDKALKAAPSDVQDYLDIVKIYQDLNKNDDILLTLNKAISVYPSERKFYNMKLKFLEQTGKKRELASFKSYMNSKFPKESIYLGKDNEKTQ